MEPYYQDSHCTIYHGDCREILPELPKVDLVLTDPPYGVTACEWDVKTNIWKFISCRAVMTASQPFTSELVMSNLKEFKHEWIWVKNKTSSCLNANYGPLKQHESVLIFGNGIYNPQMETRIESGFSKQNKPVIGKGSTLNHQHDNMTENARMLPEKRFPNSVQIINVERDNSHPTQKPVKLFKYLILTYSDENDTILDAFMGSGTTLRAAKDLNRKCIGIELEEKYCEIATNRLKQEVLAL